MENNLDGPRLKPSPLQSMHDKASDRIRLWKPEGLRRILDDNRLPTNLDEKDLERIQDVIGESYAPKPAAPTEPACSYFMFSAITETFKNTGHQLTKPTSQASPPC